MTRLTREPRPGEHVWVAMIPFYVPDPQVGVIDIAEENILAAPYIACARCVAEWSEDGDPHCPGEAEEDDQ